MLALKARHLPLNNCVLQATSVLQAQWTSGKILNLMVNTMQLVSLLLHVLQVTTVHLAQQSHIHVPWDSFVQPIRLILKVIHVLKVRTVEQKCFKLSQDALLVQLVITAWLV